MPTLRWWTWYSYSLLSLLFHFSNYLRYWVPRAIIFFGGRSLLQITESLFFRPGKTEGQSKAGLIFAPCRTWHFHVCAMGKPTDLLPTTPLKGDAKGEISSNLSKSLYDDLQK